MEVSEMIIIGTGPAGLTAAIYSARAKLNPLVLGGSNIGGQLMTTTDIENFPGFPTGVAGAKLMMDMKAQAERFGAKITYDTVTNVDFSNDIKKVFVGTKDFQAKCVIIASGSTARTLGLESEKKFWAKGVSTCATCDGAFYKEKVVAIIGGGDSAMEEAIFLTRFASKVYIIHRKPEFRASKIMQDRALANPKIEVIWNTEVREVLGDTKVHSLKIWDNKENKENVLNVDGMFLTIGHIPNTAFLKDSGVILNPEGFVEIDRLNHPESNTYTNVDGVFVAGDVHDHRYQQAIIAAGMGAMAAIDAEKWLESIK